MLNAKKHSLLLYYQCLLAVGMVLVFFTNFDNYMEAAISTPPFKIWIAAFMVACVPLILSLSLRKKYLSKPVITWIYFYTAISLLSFLLYASYDLEISVEELKSRFLVILFMFVSLLIFSRYFLVQLWTRRVILLVTIVNVFANIYGLFRPEDFVTVVESQSILATGRPAGFYVDSNRAGCVLILGMIFTIGLLPQKYRLPFILLIFIGVFVTFSRSAPLTLFIVLTILIARGEISGKRILFWISILGIGLIVLSITGSRLLDVSSLEHSDFLNNNTLERLTQFQNPTGVKELDESAIGRIGIVELSWQKILESPFIGWGTGYGLTLAEMHPEFGNIESHNMYISLMLEHGFIGALIFPSLVLASIHKASGETKTMGLAFAALLLVWGFFSHNILEHREFLLAFTFMSSINVTSQSKDKSQSTRNHL